MARENKVITRMICDWCGFETKWEVEAPLTAATAPTRHGWRKVEIGFENREQMICRTCFTAIEHVMAHRKAAIGEPPPDVSRRVYDEHGNVIEGLIVERRAD